MNMQYSIEKFTRCPRCRSFSLKNKNPDETGRVSGVVPGNIFVCKNCGTQYALQGNTLKQVPGLLQQKKQKNREKIPVRVESKPNSRPALFLILILCLIAVGIIFLLQSGRRDHEPIDASQLQLEKKTTFFQLKEDTGEDETKSGDLAAAMMTEPVHTSEKLEPTVYKVFDSSWLKVRKSSPHYSDASFRWNYKRKTITIKRSKAQRVTIAADPSGKEKWAVDDEIIINGDRIKGFSAGMTETGYIPGSKRVPPYDITHLVPSDRETVLNIRLVDYGVFWGNTSLYIVIM